MLRIHKVGSIKTLLLTSLFFLSTIATAQFKLIPLGVQGGVMTGNLTSFLLRSNETHQYLLLDAGTLIRGIAIAQKKGSLANNISPIEFANQHIAAALITHKHLDHIAGLVVESTEISCYRFTRLITLSKRSHTIYSIGKFGLILQIKEQDLN